MKVLTVQRQDDTTGTNWVDYESVFTIFKSREGKLAATADQKAGNARSHYRFHPNVRTRVIENTKHPVREVSKLLGIWSLMGAMALVFLAFIGCLVYLYAGYMHSVDHQSQEYAALRSSVLAEAPSGHTKAAEASYDLTDECLADQGFTESNATLYSRCQSLSLDFINKGSFSDSDKQAARYVITDFITKRMQLDAKYGY